MNKYQHLKSIFDHDHRSLRSLTTTTFTFFFNFLGKNTIFTHMAFSSEEDKFKNLKTHLEQDDHILVHLNPAKEGLKIPKNYQDLPTLTLKLSYSFQGKLSIDKDLIKTELLFDGKYFNCELPLSAIWGCSTTNGRNYIWPESINPDSYSLIASQIESLKGKELTNEEGPALSKVEPISKESTEDTPPEDPHTPPNLKVIK